MQSRYKIILLHISIKIKYMNFIHKIRTQWTISFKWSFQITSNNYTIGVFFPLVENVKISTQKFGKGKWLGFYSEQTGETVHSKLEKF